MSQQYIGYLIKQISDRIKVSADISLKSKGLTISQARVLEFVSDHAEGITQKAIEDYFQVSHPTVVGIISRMQKKGYLECWPDPTDRRNKMVRLTAKAQPFSEELKQDMQEQEMKLLKGLSEEQIDSLAQALGQLYENVSKVDTST